ncbi:hypothetical protein GINT2_000694 [Glugoides intestinalis]
MQEKIDLNLLIDISEIINRELKSTVTTSIHRGKTMPSDFKVLKKLAKGGYGEVYIVERNSKIYAMKKVSKQLVLKNTNTTFFMNEKEIMTTHDLDWLVRSYMCLQDESYLYYIMEFVHGGDLMGYLSKRDIMKEHEIKFYAAEIFTAVNSMHKLGWVHRDLKPDNILIDRNGHLKLGDFGSCVKLDNGKITSSNTVGTPDYISPDVLSSTGEKVVYGPEVDFWTVGVILYEMFYGITPFYSNTLKETYSKITEIDFIFEEGISDDFKDLICNLICKKESRFEFEQIKKHRFFKTIDWETLRSQEPPFKPNVENEEDISNFVDTEFEPEKTTTNSGFINFIGFTYDPDHVNNIISTIAKAYTHLMLESTKKSEYSLAKDAKVLPIKTDEQDSQELIRNISCMRKEAEELDESIKQLRKDKEELFSQVGSLNQNLQVTIEQVSNKKNHLYQIENEIQEAREQFQHIKADIIEKAELQGNIPTSMNFEIAEELNGLKKTIDRFKFSDKMNEIKESVYWLYKQNQGLSAELKSFSHVENENENKNLEDLKRQLRIQKTEIREYEQKIETEIVNRKKLEEEIKSLKRSLKEASKSFNNFVVSVLNAMTNKEVELTIENGTMRIDGKEQFLNTVFLRELKNNELHHISYKKRTLCLQMFLLNEPIHCTTTSGTRRTLKALETDLEKEEKILKGLENLLCILEGKSKEEATLQIKGSTKKIEELKNEIERAKRSTITDSQIDECENVYEFNSHLFYEKTVAKGTLCEHCNEMLYGLVNQAYCCRDCLLVVHKSCYVLVDVSCELNRAIRAGKSIPIICRTVEDKEKLLNLNKVV